LKHAEALCNLGYELHLIFGGPVIGPLMARDAEACTLFRTVKYFKTELQLSELLRETESDVYMVYIEPYWPVSLVRHMKPKAKIIVDVKDSMYWRLDGSFIGEDQAIEDGDCFMVPSEACLEELRTRTDKEINVVYSAVPERLFCDSTQTQPGLGSLGAHAVPGDQFSWRDYTDIYTAVNKVKQVYAYCPQFKGGGDPVTEHYKTLKIKMANLEYSRMLEIFSTHTWALVGNLGNDKVWGYALPNKFFDAVAAGVPIACFNAPEVEKIVLEYGIGIACTTVDELFDRWDEWNDKKANLIINRELLTMDRNILPLLELLEV